MSAICIICLGSYGDGDQRPVVGTCGHSLCRDCQGKIIGSGGRCPINDGGSFAAPKPNYLADELVELMKAKNEELEILKREHQQELEKLWVDMEVAKADNIRDLSDRLQEKDKELDELKLELEYHIKKHQASVEAANQLEMKRRPTYVHKLVDTANVNFQQDIDRNAEERGFFKWGWKWTARESDELGISTYVVKIKMKNLTNCQYILKYRVIGKEDSGWRVQILNSFGQYGSTVFCMAAYVNDTTDIPLSVKMELKIYEDEDCKRRGHLRDKLKSLDNLIRRGQKQEVDQKYDEFLSGCTDWDSDILHEGTEKMETRRTRTRKRRAATPTEQTDKGARREIEEA